MPKITETPSGPVAHVKPDEHLDLSVPPVEVDPDRIGSTPHTDPKPALVDTSAEQDLVAEGDKVKAGHVSEVDKPDEVLATAGELRKAGYIVDERVKDKEIPSAYEADTPTPPGEVRLVRHTEPEFEDITPLEAYSKRKAVSKAPKNK